MVKIATVKGDASVLNLHCGEIRDKDECSIEVVGCLVVLAGTGVTKGELSERVGDEDPVLLRGVVEVVGCLEFLRGIIATLKDGVVVCCGRCLWLLCVTGKADDEGQKARSQGARRAHLEMLHRKDPMHEKLSAIVMMRGLTTELTLLSYVTKKGRWLENATLRWRH